MVRPKGLGAALGTGRDLRQRAFFHHVPMAIGSLLGLVLFIVLRPSHGPLSLSRVVAATGDVALMLLALTLLVGVANLLLRRRTPAHSYLRRDLGTWTAAYSIVHVVLSFQGLGRGAFGFVAFFVANGRPLTSSFGLGNWTGLAALAILVGLLVISTDRYLRELKAGPWKKLQRVNYTLFALVVLHAFFYGALSQIAAPVTWLLITTVMVVLLGQLVGIWVWRRRHARAVGERHEL